MPLKAGVCYQKILPNNYEFLGKKYVALKLVGPHQ
jgi:hypothetical protein